MKGINLKLATALSVSGLLAVSALALSLSTTHKLHAADNDETARENASFIRTAASASFETDFTIAAEKTVNAVVCIKSYATPRQQQYNGYGADPFGMFEYFFGPQQRQQPQQRQRDEEPVQSGLGSGVILSADGYIVTNNHVIADADKIEVLLNDNSTYEATVVGTDEATDLALIKIPAEKLAPITFGNSENVKVGEWVLAVGNPFGFNSTVTAGIISAKARSLGAGNHKSKLSIESFIQTDAALNPGNSGGALVNLKGELIGINSAIYSNTGSYSGFSFAIPTTIVKKVMTDLKQYGTVQRAVLGCEVRELDAKLAKEKDITATKTGLLIAKVMDRSTAAELGLQKDDVITAVFNTPVQNHAQLVEQLNKYRPGDKITITYVRDNKSHTVSGTLRNSQGTTSLTQKGDFSQLGCAFMKLSDQEKKSLGITSGVKVMGLKNGPMKDAGIKDSFIILTINGAKVNSADDVESAFNSAVKEDTDEKVLFITGIYPNGKKYYYAVNLLEQ